MARCSLLAALLLLSPVLLASAQVSVAAPGTNVAVNWNGQGNSNNNDDDNNHNSNGGRCGAHAQWLQHWGHCAGGLFHAELTGSKIVPTPLDTQASGHVWACWTSDKSLLVTHMVLCNIQGYLSSHYHVGSPTQDLPPPILAIEPAQKPSDPLAPPTSLPSLKPPLDIGGNDNKHGHGHDCRMVQVTSKPSDLIVVPGGPATWDDFAAAMKGGNVYANAHTTSHPDGEIRGSFEAC